MEYYGMTSDNWLGSVSHNRGQLEKPVTDALIRAASARALILPPTGERAEKEIPLEEIEMGQPETDFLARKQYDNLASPREELTRLLADIERSAREYTNRAERNISRSAQSSSAHFSAMKAIRAKLMINADGTLKPITFRQKLFYSSRQDMLESKLKNVRNKAAKLCRKIVHMDVGDNSAKDIVLMRAFILEHVSFFFRFSLKKCFKEIDGCPPEKVDLLAWIAAWFVVGGCLLFFLYWIFAWGVKNGGETLDEWGRDYGVAVVQDVFFCEVLKIFILFVFAIISVRPQLQVIKRVINDCALSLLQDEVDFPEDVNVVHHFSPACRAACMSELSGMSASAVLRKMTDADIQNCKEHKHRSVGSITFYILVAAAVLAAISEVLIEQVMDATITSVWLSFVLLNDRLFLISPVLIIVIYAVIGGILAYSIFVYGPSMQKARRRRKERIHAAKDFHRRRSSNLQDGQSDFTGPYRSCRRIAAAFDSALGCVHSFFAREKSGQVKEKARENLLVWGGMNNPRASHAHGSIGSERAVKKSTFFFEHPTSEESASPSEKLFRPKQLGKHKTFRLPNRAEITLPGTVFPECVLKMRPTHIETAKGENVTDISDEVMAVKFFNIVPFTPSNEIFDPTISNMSTSRRSRLARIYLANTEITYDPRAALRRMLLRQVIGSAAYELKGELAELETADPTQTLLTDNDAVDLLIWIWDTYFPNMKELTPEERTGTVEHFLKWRTADRLIAVRSVRGFGSKFSEDLSFDRFSSWFLSLSGRLSVPHPADGKERIDPFEIDIESYDWLDQTANQVDYMGNRIARRSSKRPTIPLTREEIRSKSRLPRTTVFN